MTNTNSFEITITINIGDTITYTTPDATYLAEVTAINNNKVTVKRTYNLTQLRPFIPRHKTDAIKIINQGSAKPSLLPLLNIMRAMTHALEGRYRLEDNRLSRTFRESIGDLIDIRTALRNGQAACRQDQEVTMDSIPDRKGGRTLGQIIAEIEA